MSGGTSRTETPTTVVRMEVSAVVILHHYLAIDISDPQRGERQEQSPITMTLTHCRERSPPLRDPS